jgi:hypothetical protein
MPQTTNYWIYFFHHFSFSNKTSARRSLKSARLFSQQYRFKKIAVGKDFVLPTHSRAAEQILC